jgi:type I restriction enzyme, S subunit
MTASVTSNMALLIAAPEGIQLLREMIWDLAVSGLLTGEDADSWRRLPLGELGLWGSGGTPLKTHPEYYGGDIPWLVIGDLNDGLVTAAQQRITTLGLENSSAKLVPVGTVLIAMYGSIGKLGIAGLECATNQAIAHCQPDPSLVSTRYLFLMLRSMRSDFLDRGQGLAQQNISQKILKAVNVDLPPLDVQGRIVAKVDELMALCDRLEARQQDAEAAHAQLVQALLDSLTQARDADEFQACWQRVEAAFSTLFTTDGAIASLRRTILRCGVSGLLSQRLSSDRSTQDLLREVSASRGRLASAGRAWSLEDVPQASRADLAFEIPDAWAVVRAAEVCWPITSGSTPPASEMHESLGIPFLKVYNIRNQAIDFGYKPQFVSESYHDTKMRRSCLQPGDIVMNIVGPPLGKVAVIPDYFPEWNCNQAIVGFRLIPPMVPAYLYLYLCEGAFLQGIELIGTAGQDNISVTKSKHLPIPVPPMEEQHRIVAKVTELLTLCDQLKARIAAARAKHSQLAEALVEQAVAV